MILYDDGPEVRVGDRVRLADHPAVVESIIAPGEERDWGIAGPGFLILCEGGDRILIEPGSFDWADLAFVRRGD